jgi:hypothetical protein
MATVLKGIFRKKPLPAALATACLSAVCLLAGCASLTAQVGTVPRGLEASTSLNRDSVWENIVARVEEKRSAARSKAVARPLLVRQSSDAGQTVLATGYRIAFEEKRVVTGSCWDFVNAVYDAAGFPVLGRSTVFLGSQEGPYADPAVLQPGDWVMHRNLEFGEIEHSSIFVQWIDRENCVARTLDYVGMNRSVTARLTQHRYAKVFAILRPAARQ